MLSTAPLLLTFLEAYRIYVKRHEKAPWISPRCYLHCLCQATSHFCIKLFFGYIIQWKRPACWDRRPERQLSPQDNLPIGHIYAVWRWDSKLWKDGLCFFLDLRLYYRSYIGAFNCHNEHTTFLASILALCMSGCSTFSLNYLCHWDEWHGAGLLSPHRVILVQHFIARIPVVLRGSGWTSIHSSFPPAVSYSGSSEG